MKHLIVPFMLFILLFTISNNTFAADSSKIYFDFIASGTEELKLDAPQLLDQPLKGDIDTDGFILGTEFTRDNYLFGIEYASLSYEGGGDASCFDILSGFGFSENTFFTIEWLLVSSDSDIDYSGMLFGIKGSADLGEQFYFEGNFAMNLLIDGTLSVNGIKGAGDTEIIKYGVKLGFKATENVVATLGYRVQDMTYTEPYGSFDITDSAMTLGIKASF